MKWFFFAVIVGVPTAFLWRLTERLQDDTLAMMMGGGGVLVVVIVLLAFALAMMRFINGDRADERRRNNQASAWQADGQPPVIVITGGGQPQRIDRQSCYGKLPADPQSTPTTYRDYSQAGRRVQRVTRVPQRIEERQWQQIGEREERI